MKVHTQDVTRDKLLDKYADLATDLADGATQIDFHNFHGVNVWPDVFVNIRNAMGQLLADPAASESHRSYVEGLEAAAKVMCIRCRNGEILLPDTGWHEGNKNLFPGPCHAQAIRKLIAEATK